MCATNYGSKVAVMSASDLKLLIGVIVLIGLPLAGWYFRSGLMPAEEAPVVAEPPPPVSEEPAPIGPIYPIAPLALPPGPDGRIVELPPLDDSDAYFLLALGDVFGTGIEPLLASEGLIDRFVASVDALPRDTLSEKIRAVGRLSTPFRPGDYSRYDALIGMAASAGMNLIVDTYRRFYPLLQEAYERLGYPNAYFNDRVVEVIDHLLTAPELDAQPELVRPNVLYEYADPDLERLSAGHKLMLRVGPEHAVTIKSLLRRLRGELSARKTR